MNASSSTPRRGTTTVLAWVVLVALLLLAYDSGRDALGAYRSGHLDGPRGAYVVRACDPAGCSGDFTAGGRTAMTGVPLDAGGNFREGDRGRVVLHDGRAVPLRPWGYQAMIGAAAALAAALIGLWLLRGRRAGARGEGTHAGE